MAELLMDMDNATVQRLQRAFIKDKDEESTLNMQEFVVMMMDNLGSHHDSMDVVGKSMELFKQIDANGDGSIDWGEFSAFIIDLNKTSQENCFDEIDELRFRKVETPLNFRFNLARKAIFWQECDDVRFATAEARSDKLKLHLVTGSKVVNYASVRVTSNFISHVVLGGISLLTTNQVVVSSKHENDFFLSLHALEGGISLQREQIRMFNGQKLFRWHAKSSILCTSGTSRGDAKGHVISVFQVDPKEGTLLHKVKHRLIWHYRPVTSMEFITHQHLTAGSLDGTASIWDLETGMNLTSVNVHETGVQMLSSISFVPTDDAKWSSFWVRAKPNTILGKVVSCPKPRFGENVSAKESACAIVWDMIAYYKDLREEVRLIGHKYPTINVKIVPESGYVITGDAEGECRLWNPTNNYACVQVIPVATPSFMWIDNQLVTFAFAHGKNQVFELGRAEKERTPIIFARLNQTMSCIVTATKNEVMTWDLESRKRVTILKLRDHEPDITACCLDDRERKLIVGNEFGAIRVYNLMNGALIKLLDSHPSKKPITGLHFCSLDRLVVSTSWGGHIQISDENDRLGTIEGKRSVKYRSIHLKDKGNGEYDITASAVNHYLKQIATFSEKKLRKPNRSTMSTSNNNNNRDEQEQHEDIAGNLYYDNDNDYDDNDDDNDSDSHKNKSDKSIANSGHLLLEDVVEKNALAKNQQRNEEETVGPMETSIVYIWDVEFARLQGICKGDPGSIFTQLVYSCDKTLPLLFGLDIVQKTVSIWYCGIEDIHLAFQRVSKISVPCTGPDVGLTSMSLQQAKSSTDPERKLNLFVGDDSGQVIRYNVYTAVQTLSKPVRYQTYRGNRFAKHEILMEDIRANYSLSMMEESSILEFPEMSTELVLEWQVNNNQSISVSTMSVMDDDNLLLVGYDNGSVQVMNIDDGSPCCKVETCVVKTLPPEISCIEMKEFKRKQDREVKRFLLPPKNNLQTASTGSIMPPLSTRMTSARGRYARSSTPAPELSPRQATNVLLNRIRRNKLQNDIVERRLSKSSMSTKRPTWDCNVDDYEKRERKKDGRRRKSTSFANKDIVKLGAYRPTTAPSFYE